MYSTEPGSVIEFDLYHAESLLPLSDEAIMTRMLQTYLAPALPGGLEQAETLTVKDSSVLRFRNAVTRFSPGSHALLPDIVTSIPNVFVAGDCVKQGPGTHGCKGLSQEKAYVSGLQVGITYARISLCPCALMPHKSWGLDTRLRGSTHLYSKALRTAAGSCVVQLTYLHGVSSRCVMIGTYKAVLATRIAVICSVLVLSRWLSHFCCWGVEEGSCSSSRAH